jgi:hypothetical protein
MIQSDFIAHIENVFAEFLYNMSHIRDPMSSSRGYGYLPAAFFFSFFLFYFVVVVVVVLLHIISAFHTSLQLFTPDHFTKQCLQC